MLSLQNLSHTHLKTKKSFLFKFFTSQSTIRNDMPTFFVEEKQSKTEMGMKFVFVMTVPCNCCILFESSCYHIGDRAFKLLKPPFPGSKPSGAREEDKELFVLYIYHRSLIQSEDTFL
jgi:hypothetical protein